MRKLPEILAPAGDEASLAAALAAGADAVYFGLDEGMNARARAANFPVATLPATCDRIHRAGAKAYLTLNTLVFEDELPFVETLIRRAAEAGVDALIVQDPATALLARAVAPTLEVHASTQMTVSSPEAARFAARLGITRVVVPRELSVDEIRTYAAGTALELEVFVHGALCVSWSGQCLTSEAWGGRSANRGQCAQSCRLPYGLVVDGALRDTADVRYLLSPLDLAAVRSIPGLADAGVASLKIEGRMKGPAYVATAVAAYRRLRDGQPIDLGPLALAYSRGFSDGFLAGTDHQGLVEGRFPKHRGLLLGTVAEVDGDGVRVVRAARTHGLPATAEPGPGMGVGFDTGEPEAEEPGGALFSAEPTADGWWLRFGRRQDLSRVAVGHRVWLTGDPRLDREARALAEPVGRLPVALAVTGRLVEPLRVTLSTARGAASGETSPAGPATGRGLDEELVREKLGALGGTPFRLDRVDLDLAPGLHVPPGELKALRRRLVAELEEVVLRSHRHAVDPRPAAPRVVAEARALDAGPRTGEPELVPLCRTDAQLDAVLARGFRYVELDWMERVGLGRAVERARAAGLAVGIATVRVQKPGETGVDAHTERLRPDAVLVRHWGGLEHFAGLPPERRPVVHGDFSLNVTNSVTAHHLLALGCETLTASHDLDERQLHALLREVPAGRIAVVVHHHVPTFHTEHCVYARMLSTGRDFRTCGRPCERHRLALRDEKGLDHPVVVDVGCRNTVFEARAWCTPSALPGILERGVRRFRVEFVWEDAEEAGAVLDAWRALLARRISAAELVRRVAAHEQFGVTKGTMRTLGGAP